MFITRTISGGILLIISIAAIAYGKFLLLGILCLISMIAFRELTKAVKSNDGDRGFNALEIIGFLGVISYYGAVYGAEYYGNNIWLLMSIVVTFLAELFVYVIAFPKYRAEQVIGAVFSFIYAPVMLSFIYMTRSIENGLYIVWLILISSWGCDTCAYCVGKLIGKKKIFPVLSPNKSLEGCIGGVLGAALIGGLYAYFFASKAYPDTNIVAAIAFISAVGSIMSMMGDLAASAIKRNHNIKDYGKVIPGHGGIMDRFDSTIVTAPMVYLLAILLLK